MSYTELDEQIDDEILDDDYDNNKIDDNISLNSSDFISKPIKSKTCTIDENTIQLHHSFGYDCYSKIFNICAADDHTVVYAAGSFINMLDIKSGKLSFRKCAGNGGIGHIAKNPVLNHLAVGEKCIDPLIIVYDWPTFNVISVLKGGSKRKINWLTYSQDGNYLCSQGGGPDNILTIWDWKNSKIILRTTSHTQDVYVCEFSKFLTDHLVTAGLGHIKFWKMADTFTGLKLQGQLGRFGKTEISDVIGIFSMPDERVISGCEWGNILIWDEELIDVQIMSRGRKPCHSAPIIKFLYSEHDMKLISISMDGTIKYWYYHTVMVANPPENDRVVKMEPSFIIDIKDSIGNAKIMGICKIDHNPDSYDYFVQDGNGGIWLVDIKVAVDSKPLKRLAKFHGDVITSLQASPVGYFFATTSLDGWFHVYDAVNKKLIFMHDFKEPITSLIWLPKMIASTGNMFIVGFQTGILKIIAVPLKESTKGELLNLTEIQNSKPHSSKITHLTTNRSNQILVCGSDDCSIFVYKIETKPIKLNPIGKYPLPGKVTFIYWKPSETKTALISCSSGHIVEVNIPTSRPQYTKESFILKLESRVIKTVSIKSELLLNQYTLDMEHKKREKIKKKKEKLKIIKEENVDEEIDEDLYFRDSDEDEVPPKMFIPPISNPILFAMYTPSEKSLWVSIDGYDAGYLYEYDFNKSTPINATMIPDKNNIPMTAIKIIETDPLKVLMGFADGRIRITNIRVEDPSDLSDFIEYSVHDNEIGNIQLCFSQDNKMLYSYGGDGNIFSFMFKCDHGVFKKCIKSISSLPPTPKLFEEDIIKTKEDLKCTLEERKINYEKRKALKLANKEKDKLNCLLYGLKERFKQVLNNNKALPESLQFSRDYFKFDERINNLLIEEAQTEMDKLKLIYSFDYEKSLLGLEKVKNYFVKQVLTPTLEVKGILKDVGVKTMHHEIGHTLFHRLLEEFGTLKHPKLKQHKSTVVFKSFGGGNKDKKLEIFLKNIREMYSSLPKKVQSAIDQFSTRMNLEMKEILEIDSIQNENLDDMIIEEEILLDDAWKITGGLNLKTASDFKPSDDQNISMEDKFYQYTNVKNEMDNLKVTFNKKVFNLRQNKIQLIRDYKQFKFDVNMIQNILNDSKIMTPSNFPEVLIDESIDPTLVDSFEPTESLDLEYLILYHQKINLHVKISKEDLNEYPTHLEKIMLEMKKEKFKHRHNCLHEFMLTKINMFDEDLLSLEKERKDISLHITFLNLFALTLEEELFILNDFDLLEDKFSYSLFLKTGKQNEQVKQIDTIQSDIEYNKNIIENQKIKLENIEQTFAMEIQKSTCAKFLRKVFKKKFKKPKIYSDIDDESTSSSSSDESDDSVVKSHQSGSEESIAIVDPLVVFDENVLPDGCNPKLYDLTFELRSQRHEIEQDIETVKNKLMSLNRILNSANAELDITNNEIRRMRDELEAYRIKKQLKLNEVETTILLKTQINNVKLLKSSILVSENDIELLENREVELKKEKESIKKSYKNEKLRIKKLRIEKNAMKRVLKEYEDAIKNEIKDKFGMEKDWSFLDNMEMTIINSMIIEANFNPKEIEDHFIKELKSLENEIEAHKEIYSDSLKAKNAKTITLQSVYEGVLKLKQLLSIQHKYHEKVQDLSIESTQTSDIIKLKDDYNTLLKRKQDICKEINRLKCNHH